ncbi:MAG: hypothetical protein ABI234_03100 [Ktedonobacteraceae bacterium]
MLDLLTTRMGAAFFCNRHWATFNTCDCEGLPAIDPSSLSVRQGSTLPDVL